MKFVVLGLSLLATVYVWWRLLHWKEHAALKVAIALLALFPVVGPLMCLWVVGMPEPADPALRATMNHRGRGGRFIGFGSGKFNYDPGSERGEDWNPSVPERQRAERENERK
jgi:hypothetical protein